MKFALALNLSPEVSKHAQSFNEVSGKINSVTIKRDYGKDVEELYIGLICVSPQFEPFFKLKKPKYVDSREEYKKDGVNFSFERMLEYEVKLDFSTMISLDQESAKRELSYAILNSIQIIKSIKKIKDFDISEFENDLIKLFKELNIL